jgi:hypothetical protein
MKKLILILLAASSVFVSVRAEDDLDDPDPLVIRATPPYQAAKAKAKAWVQKKLEQAYAACITEAEINHFADMLIAAAERKAEKEYPGNDALQAFFLEQVQAAFVAADDNSREEAINQLVE